MGVKSTKEVNESKEALEMGEDINEALAALEEMEGEFDDLSKDLSIDDVEGLSKDLDDMDLDEALKALEDPQVEEDDTPVGEPPMPADSTPVEETKEKEKKTSKSSKKTSKKEKAQDEDGRKDEEQVEDPVPASSGVDLGPVIAKAVTDALDERIDQRITKLFDDLHKAQQKDLKSLVSATDEMTAELKNFTQAWTAGAELQRENTNGVINRLDNLANQMATVMAQMDKIKAAAGGTKTKDGEEDLPADEKFVPKGHQEFMERAMNTLVAKGVGARSAAKIVKDKMAEKGLEYTEDEIIKATKPS